jgi:uncharacterized RDD family membrane protein YckC
MIHNFNSIMSRILTTLFIKIFTIITALLGISEQFLPNNIYRTILSMYSPVHIYFFTDLIDIHSSEFGFHIQVLTILFYTTLLISGIIYLKKGETEARLIRFCFSIILVFNIVKLVQFSLALITTISIKGEGFALFILGLGTIFSILFIYLSFGVIKKLSTNELAIVTTELENESIENLVSTSKSERFIHLIVDGLIVWISFSTFLDFLGPFLRKASDSIGERLTLLLFFIISRTIYYLIFEYTLNATPAKFLTQSRVVDDNGGKVAINTLTARTLYRFIPFEPFSFFTSNGGLHDIWSNTYIVKEKRLGKEGQVYWSLLPILFLLGGGIIFSAKKYEKKLSQEKTDMYYQKIFQKHEKEFQILSPEFVLIPEIKYDITSNSGKVIRTSSTKAVWKIERIEGDSLICLVIYPDSYFSEKDIRKAYNSQKTSADTIKISKLDAYKTLPIQGIGNHPKTFIDIENGKRSYGITDYHAYFGIDLKSVGGGFSESLKYKGKRQGTLSLENRGIEGTVTKIEVLEGIVVCNTPVPIKLERNENGNDKDRITFELDNYTDRDNFKILLTIQNANGETRQFIFESCGDTPIVMPK